MGIGSAAEKDLKYKPGPGFIKHPISSTFKLFGEGFFLSNALTLPMLSLLSSKEKGHKETLSCWYSLDSSP